MTNRIYVDAVQDIFNDSERLLFSINKCPHCQSDNIGEINSSYEVVFSDDDDEKYEELVAYDIVCRSCKRKLGHWHEGEIISDNKLIMDEIANIKKDFDDFLSEERKMQEEKSGLIKKLFETEENNHRKAFEALKQILDNDSPIYFIEDGVIKTALTYESNEESRYIYDLSINMRNGVSRLTLEVTDIQMLQFVNDRMPGINYFPLVLVLDEYDILWSDKKENLE